MQRLTPRQDRIRLLLERRARIEAELRVLIEAERDNDAPTPGPKCGSENGYKHHQRNGESACDECMDAHRAYERERRARAVAEAEAQAVLLRKPRRSRNEVPECGSESAYQRHRHKGDTSTDERRVTCQPCVDAHAAHERQKAALRRAKRAA